MAGHRKFSELRARMSPERRERNQVATKAMLAAMPLAELRHARELTQVRLAELIGTTQPDVSRIEQQADVYVSTLRSYIEALGGTLEIIARFADGAVKINQFHDSGEPDPQPRRRAVASAA